MDMFRSPSHVASNATSHVLVERRCCTRLRYQCRKLPWPYITAVLLLTTVAALVISTILVDTFMSKDKRRSAQFDEAYQLELIRNISRANATWIAVFNKQASAAAAAEEAEEEEDPSYESIVDEGFNASILRESIKHRVTLEQVELPAEFDARVQWPLCHTISAISNQGSCGSCWAVSAAAVISDRICIHSGGRLKPQISAEDILSCCKHCAFTGCQGSLHITAYTHWARRGVVSGGEYGSFEGCKPYSIPSKCGAPCGPADYDKYKTPKCKETCIDIYAKTYEEDKFYGGKIYWISGLNLTKRDFKGKPNITELYQLIYLQLDERIAVFKRELMKNGPFGICSDLLEDIQHYSSGIYRRVAGKVLYGHCMKLIGWGRSESGIDYWIVSNTWGRNWGEYGTFRWDMRETPEEAAAGLPLNINN